MTDKQAQKIIRCVDCGVPFAVKYKFCPECGIEQSKKKTVETLDDIEKILSDTTELIPNQYEDIFKVIKLFAKDDPSRAHLMEDKLNYKFLGSLIGEINYTVSDINKISRILLRFRSLSYGKTY